MIEAVLEELNEKPEFWSQVLAAGAPANDLAAHGHLRPLADAFVHVAIGRQAEGLFMLFLVSQDGNAHLVRQYDNDSDVYADWLSLSKRLGLPRYCFIEAGIAVPFDPQREEGLPRRRGHVLGKRRPRFLALRMTGSASLRSHAKPGGPTKQARR